MRGNRGRGAALGVVAGVVVVFLLVLGPAVLSGDYYEIADPLFYMGVPLLGVATVAGALVGAPGRGSPGSGDAPVQPRAARVAPVVAAAGAVIAYVLVFAVATGVVR